MEMEYHYKQKFLVGYGEVDEHNHLRLTSLLNFLQAVATLHSNTLGYGTTQCKEMGMAWMTLSWHIKMFSYPKGDTEIVVKTWSRGIKGCHAYRSFEVTDGEGNLVAYADSLWGWIDVNTKHPVRPTEEMITKFSAIDRKLFEEEKIKIKEPETIDGQIELSVQRRDIDTNHHCNNTKYMDYALEAIPDEIYAQKQIEEVEIVYKKPVVYRESIKVTYTFSGENEIICQILNSQGEVANLVKTTWKNFEK